MTNTTENILPPSQLPDNHLIAAFSAIMHIRLPVDGHCSVFSGPGMRAGVAGDAEQGCSAAAERRSVDGALC